MADMEDLRQQVYDAISRARHLDTYEATHRENVDLTDAVVGVFADVVEGSDRMRAKRDLLASALKAALNFIGADIRYMSSTDETLIHIALERAVLDPEERP